MPVTELYSLYKDVKFLFILYSTFYIIIDEPFLRSDPKKSMIVDYSMVTPDSSDLRINVYFQGSGPFTLDWFLNRQNIYLDNDQEGGERKYSSSCIASNIFDVHCILFIEFYNVKDTGTYEAAFRLKENPNVIMNVSVVAIMPSMNLLFRFDIHPPTFICLTSIFLEFKETPESVLLIPRYCSQNWTCEVGKKTYLQCNSQAHNIELIRIFTIDCGTFEECYAQKKNETLLESLLLEMDEEFIKLKYVEIKENEAAAASGDGGFLNTGRSGVPTTTTSLDDYLLDNYKLDKGEIQQLSPAYYNRLELLDNGLTWSYKTKFHIENSHLVICIARNEIGGELQSLERINY